MKIYGIKTESGKYLDRNGYDWHLENNENTAKWDDKELAKSYARAIRDLVPEIKLKIWSVELV